MLSLLIITFGFLVSVWIVRAALAAHAVRGRLEPSRGPALALLLGLPALVLIAGVPCLLRLCARRPRGACGQERLEEATLEAEEAFAQAYDEVSAASSNGPGFDPSIFGAQTRLREAADALAAVDPPEDELDDEHESLVEGLRSFSKGLESVEDHPPGTDLSELLPGVDGVAEIRAALLGLRAAGYRVDRSAWQLVV